MGARERTIDAKIVEKAKIERARKGWSQVTMAQKAGVSVCVVSFFESGKNISTKSLVRILDALGIEVEKV